MRFARWIFLLAGIYGLLTLAPQYFAESRFSRDYPPAITHPEFFYGFIGVALAWQILFLFIGFAPARLRPAMLPAILEKALFALAVPVLLIQGRSPAILGLLALVDGLWGVLFVIAYIRSGQKPATAP